MEIYLFSLISDDGARGNVLELCQGRFGLDISKKREISEKMVRHWNRLQREVVESRICEHGT